MQLKISQLYGATVVVARAVRKQNAMPILSNFLVRPIRGAVEVIGSDLETTVIATIPVEGNGCPTFVVDADLLTNILAQNIMRGDDNNMMIDTTDRTVSIQTHFSMYKVPILFDAAQYPEMVTRKKHTPQSATIPPQLLKVFAKNIERRADNALMSCLHFQPGRVFATDGYKAFELKTECNITGALPVDGAKILGSLMVKGQPQIEYAFNHFFYKLDNIEVFVRAKEDVKLPSKTSDIFQSDRAVEVEIDRQDMIGALRRMAVVCDATTLTISAEGSAEFTARDASRGEALESFTVDALEAPLSISVNPLFLIGALSVFDSDYIKLRIGEPTDAITATDNNISMAVMPTRKTE